MRGYLSNISNLLGASPFLYVRLAAQCFIMSSDAFLELQVSSKNRFRCKFWPPSSIIKESICSMNLAAAAVV